MAAGQTKVSLLGATGSIGRSSLSVLALHREQYQVVAVSAYSDADALFAICQEHQPEVAVMVDHDAAKTLADAIKAAGLSTQVAAGPDGLAEAAVMGDTLISGIVGAAGLVPTFAAVQAGKRVLIANKEPLVMAGRLLMTEAKKSGAEILPVDSEHNAIFQCLPPGYRCGQRPNGVKSIILTASGGPFRDKPLSEFADITPEHALRHPNWEMGKKISIDSATMMNKGLEVIEAAMLFDMTNDEIEVILHPQSAIHSLVRYADGSLLAQLGVADMRTPIASALAWPQRIEAGVESLDLVQMARLDFAVVDPARFPSLGLARQALREGRAMPAVLNAANEVAVEMFLNGRISFTQIAELVEVCLESAPNSAATGSISELIALDAEVRRYAKAVYSERLKPAASAAVVH